MNFEDVRLRLINEQPFYALFLNKCRVIFNDKVGTAGVRLNKRGEIEMHVSEKFLNTLSVPHQVGLLIHEMLHVMFDHIGERGKDLNMQIANIAMDVAINQMIDKHLLPPEGLLPEMYGLPENLAFEPYYLELMQKAKENSKNGKGKGEGKGGFGLEGSPLDNHDFFENETVGGVDAQKIIAEAIQGAMDECKQNFPGSVPMEISRMLDEFRKKAKVNWKAELRKFIGRNLSDHAESTRTRPNRRLGLAAMGKRREYVPKILVLGDWSGSVSDEMACECLDELKGILKSVGSEKTDVAFFDTEIVDKCKLNSFSKLPPRSRSGGTSFKVAFEYAHEVKPDLLIMLTDAGDSMPDIRLNCPVMWIVVGGYQTDHLKGKVISI